jgi:hypothetical protein
MLYAILKERKINEETNEVDSITYTCIPIVMIDNEPNIIITFSADGKNYTRNYRLNAMVNCINVCSETQLGLYYNFLQELAPRDILTQDYIGFPCAKGWLG